MDTAALTALFEAIVDNRVLTHLTIRNNVITDNGISAIAKTLKNNRSIRLLSLRGDHIGDGALLELGTALRWNPSLIGVSYVHLCIALIMQA